MTTVDPDQPDDPPQPRSSERWPEFDPETVPYPDADLYPSNSRSPSSIFQPRTGASLRAIIAVVLVASTILLVLLGIILRIPPNEMVQYLAPITPLAGAALGYWYGTDR